MDCVTPGCCSIQLPKSTAICLVIVWDVPSGKVVLTMTKPLSSDGTKPVGMMVNKNPEIPEIIIRKATLHLMRRFKCTRRIPYQFVMRSKARLNCWKNLKMPFGFSVGL